MAHGRHAEIATLEWIDWWNHRQLHESIGDVPSAEKEASYYAAKEGAGEVGIHK